MVNNIAHYLLTLLLLTMIMQSFHVNAWLPKVNRQIFKRCMCTQLPSVDLEAVVLNHPSLSSFPELSRDQKQNLVSFCRLVVDWNSKVNLISRKDIDNIVDNHLIPSLAVSKVANFRKGDRVIDVGTGGGFPGLPLAIAFPNVSFTLIDSQQKKVAVVEDIIKQLKLPNARAICTRAEQYDGQFGYVLGRSVASLREFITYTSHLMNAVNTRCGIFYIKGGDFTEEFRGAGLGISSVSIVNIKDIVSSESDKKILHIPPAVVRKIGRSLPRPNR